MNAINFRVVGDPKAQPRPRAFARKFGDKFSARIYDAGTAEGWKGLIAQEARPKLPAAPLAGAVRIDADFLFKRPNRLLKKSSPAGRIWHTAKPDRDNLDKALLDCLTQIGLLSDDAVVCEGEPRKFYAAIGEQPGAVVTITTLEEPASPAVPSPLFAARRESEVAR